MLLSFSFLLLAHLSVASPHLRSRGPKPQYFTDPSTTQYCTWYVDNDGSQSCSNVLSIFGITISDFRRWNPTITVNCENFNSFQSYCVEALDEPATSVTTTPTASSTLKSSLLPSTTSGNGVTTPLPTQPGMVNNCNKFYLVQKDEGCTDIANRNGITFSQFLAWNPTVGQNCEGLWANVNVCIGTIGATPTSPISSQPATTTPGNGITTPLPTQPGMVENCNKFYKTKADDGCTAIALSNGITPKEFQSWNPTVGDDCRGLWANVYVCVSIIGRSSISSRPSPTTPPPTSTTGNGITTPTPTQTGMVGNCNKFHYVLENETCDSIAKAAGISTANFVKWNPAVGGQQCKGLWAKTYACIGVV